MGGKQMSTVRRRCVFYVGGFDPKGARFYEALYREQAAIQAKVNGMRIVVGSRRRLADGNSCWDLQADTPSGSVHTHYEFMRWDDIVRAYWPKNIWHLWWKIIFTSILYLRTGALWKMYKLSWPAAVAVFLPFLLLLGAFILPPPVAFLVHRIVFAVTNHDATSWIVAGLAALCLLVLAWRVEARYRLYWLMRSYAFTGRQGLGRLPDLEARLDALASSLVKRVANDPYDEVLVIGHSSGAIMAASILARALKLSPQLADEPGRQFALMTLGHCIPLLGLLPQAREFRRQLETLGAVDHLDWIDFSAPPDGCCFALVDPLAACGLVPVPERPKLLSPRFAEMFGTESYRMLREDKLRLHFQYLRAAEEASLYDYFLITAGDMTLSQRFAGTPGVAGYSALRPWK